jgi:hypothetical protein
LSGAEKQIAGANGVIIRADGGRRFCGFNDVFVCQEMICFDSEMRSQSVVFVRQRQGVGGQRSV